MVSIHHEDNSFIRVIYPTLRSINFSNLSELNSCNVVVAL